LFLSAKSITLIVKDRVRLCYSSQGNPTYTATMISKNEIIDKSVLYSFGVKVQEYNLLSLYWIPKLHDRPYKKHCIVGASKCSSNPLSTLLTSTHTTAKTGLQRYHDTCFSRNGVNQMRILKTLKTSWRL